MPLTLAELGWKPAFSKGLDALNQPDLLPGRVAREDRHAYLTLTERGDFTARVSGRLRHEARSRKEFPAVGDWVALAPGKNGSATIHAVLPRQSCFSRKVVLDRMEEQVVAANVDTVFLVTGLDTNYNLRRIERYLTVAWDSGATPVVLLNKVDLCDEPERRAEEVDAIAPGVDVHLVSAATGEGMSALHAYLGSGRTLAFLGSSGVGKSSLINQLLGEERQAVGSVREEDGKGRHTTRRRELIHFPEGGLLIDTPGMRELQLWSEGDGLARTFDDIETLAAGCKFSDCAHDSEPGCAVRAAVEAGELDTARFESYRKMRSELAFLEERRNKSNDQMERDKWRGVSKEIKRFYKRQGRR